MTQCGVAPLDQASARTALDELFTLARKFNSSEAYLELIRFVGRFRFYSPFNAMLIYTQMPGARYVCTALKWQRGHGASAILVRAYMRGAGHIDAIDRRIASYERRRNTALREAGMWNESLRRKLEHATTAIIDGEFTDVAEKH